MERGCRRWFVIRDLVVVTPAEEPSFEAAVPEIGGLHSPRGPCRGALREAFSLGVCLEKPERVKPVDAKLSPARGKCPVLADAEVVFAPRKNVQLNGNLGPL